MHVANTNNLERRRKTYSEQMVQKSLFSIIIPTFNSARTLETCLESIVSQTYDIKEVIIIDGLSTDGTLDIVQAFQQKFNYIKYISEKDRGIYDAMNKGIKIAKGEWLYFLGSDDYLYNKHVLETINTTIANLDHSFDIIYGNIASPKLGNNYGGEFDRYRILKKNICHQAIFYRRTIFQRLGNYNLRYKLWADYELNLRCFLDSNIRTKHLEIVIAFYSDEGVSSLKNDSDFLKDFYHLVKHNGCKTLPLKDLRKLCYSRLDYLSVLVERYAGIRI
jgi:glycosyltransferase involved in cell wall biosynthesis